MNPGPRRRIMIVDDMEDIRQILNMILSTVFEVVEARDGQEAVDFIDDVEPDLVIMDVEMPRMTGFEATDAIRKMPKYQHLDIMFLTSLKDKDSMMKGYGAGGSLYLTKPFEPERVLKNITVFFEKTPPPVYQKKYKIEELEERIKSRRTKKKAKPAAAPVESQPAPRPVAPQAAPQTTPASSDADNKELQDAIAKARSAQQSMDFSKKPSSTEHVERIKPVSEEEKKKEKSLKYRVLVVDADVRNMSIARSALVPKIEVVTAGNLEEAIDKIERFEPDILLLDSDTMGLNYKVLVDKAKELTHQRSIPCLFSKKKPNPHDLDKAMDEGAFDVIHRPFNEKEIKTIVEDLTMSPSLKPHKKKLPYEQIKDM